jgi:hypothetical protein
MRLRLISVVLSLCILSGALTANVLERKPYSFDPGPAGSSSDPLSVALNRLDSYNASRGFGWTTQVPDAFSRERERTRTLRDDLTYDGVTGKSIGFQINLPKGEWWCTFWIEVGFEDSATTVITIGGKPQSIVWHHLKPDEEGRVQLSPVYRVIHSRFLLSDDGLTFELRGVQDSVRLLGFTFIPAQDSGLDANERLARLITDAGRYKSAVTLSDLAQTLTNELQVAPTSTPLFYWRQQIGFMAEAERLRAMLGWEWATQITGVSIFDRMHQALMLLDANIENFPQDNNPLLERARWMRGKICYDLVLERGGRYQARVGRADLRWLLERHPTDPTLIMLNGGRVDLPDPSDHLLVKGNPPGWAVLEREVISRLKTEIDWWVNQRQAANGELGGKIDDDVEILRTWIPMLLFGDRNTILGWKRLADAVWVNPRVYNGFSKNVRDVEHSAEFISDSTPELLVVDNDSTYLKRLMFTPDYFENLWSGKNRFGRRFFKSAWLGATAIDVRPPRDRDVDMNSRALKPLRYLAWATHDERYVRLTDEWARAWLSAALRSDKGKPAGIIPASIRGADEAINGDEPNWYDANMLWDYYSWENRCGNAILDHFTFTYGLTGNDSLLLPIELTLRLIQEQMGRNNALQGSQFTPGSEPWIAQRLLKNSAFWSTVQKWRMLTDNAAFDDLLRVRSTPYLKYRMSGDERSLEEGLNELLETLRVNTPLRTDLVVHTDRVRIPGIDHLKGMIAGDATHEGNSPYFAVSWANTDESFAPLVNVSTTQELRILAYSFRDEKRSVVLRPWHLKPGKYEMTTRNGQNVATEQVTITRPGQSIGIEVLPQSLSEIRLFDIRKDGN